MTEDQLKDFLKAVAADGALKQQLEAAPDLNAVIAIAKKAGFFISATSLMNAQLEVSESALEGMAGTGSTDDTCWTLVDTCMKCAAQC